MDPYVRLYRRLIRLYPKSFRDDYGEPLAQHFSDLAADRGLRSALLRTSLDLAITVPRYRMESFMSERQTTTAIVIAIWAFAAAGAASVLTGVGPSLLFFGAAAVLAFVQRGALARSLRTPNSDLRRRRLRIAAITGVIFVTSYAVYISVIGDTWTTRETVLAIIGNLSMFCSIGYLVAGLLTPKSRSTEV